MNVIPQAEPTASCTSAKYQIKGVFWICNKYALKNVIVGYCMQIYGQNSKLNLLLVQILTQ